MKIGYILPIFIEGSFSLRQSIIICTEQCRRGLIPRSSVTRAHLTHRFPPVLEIFTCFSVALLKSKPSTGNIIGTSEQDIHNTTAFQLELGCLKNYAAAGGIYSCTGNNATAVSNPLIFEYGDRITKLDLCCSGADVPAIIWHRCQWMRALSTLSPSQPRYIQLYGLGKRFF